ncbi:molybdopterin-binding protein [Motilibacter peucedani]|uniref:Molybdopterin-binding protein n=1 Tax=Motilibacter peucedani TaxID=598650 RepID=A0A420XUV7_9ACTN|nr:TOBE domain-containing protein [Motilibacter peucedani]RKS80439.1 molybdopterin-binding protein [Motilibacter peucedani]
MAALRISEATRLLGVSDDTLRRWVEAGRLEARTDEVGRLVVEGAELARVARERAERTELLEAGPIVSESARNRFTGIVTRVTKDLVMAQVEIQAGPFRVVSLMSSEAATELGLEPGVLAVASVKSTNVVVEVPQQRA